jgi:long-subunit acyl-CoA synthetase (AMP-forming)
VRSLVMKECNAAGKKQGFKTMEMLEAVILTPDDWTPENGLVTAAQKINRKKVSGKFNSEIKVRFHMCLRGCMNSADVTLRRSTSINEH